MANVQPLKLDYLLMESGHSLTDRWVCLVPAADVLRAAVDDRIRDEVIVFGETFGVVESKNWPGDHTWALLFRQI